MSDQPIRREGMREVRLPDGVTLIDACVCAGRLFAFTDAGTFEVADGVARPLPILGVEEGKEWERARQELAARALAKNTDTTA